jgi:hypothetical protein
MCAVCRWCIQQVMSFICFVLWDCGVGCFFVQYDKVLSIFSDDVLYV